MSSTTSGAGLKRSALLPASKWSPAFYTPRKSIITDGGMAIVKNFVDSLEAGATAGAAAAEQQSVAS